MRTCVERDTMRAVALERVRVSCYSKNYEKISAGTMRYDSHSDPHSVHCCTQAAAHGGPDHDTYTERACNTLAHDYCSLEDPPWWPAFISCSTSGMRRGFFWRAASSSRCAA